MGVMVMMAMRTTGCLRQVLNVGQRIILGRVRKVGCKLVQLGSLGCVPIRRSGVGGILKVSGDLRGDLLVLRWIGLLQLL